MRGQRAGWLEIALRVGDCRPGLPGEDFMRRLLVSTALGLGLAAGAAHAQPAAADRVAAIASIQAASGASFSPDGSKVVFTSNASGSPQVWIAPAAGGPAVQITKLTEPVQGVLW